MIYRDYQNEAVLACYRAWANGNRRQMMVLATGTGKSVIITKIVEGWDIKNDGGIIILAHKRKLVEQMKKHLERLGLQVGIEMGLDHCLGDEDVIIGTVQSISRRLKKFNLEATGLIIVDEAHHDTKSSIDYSKVEEWARGKPDIYRLGVTATPQRADGVGFTDRYHEEPCYSMPLHEAIDRGWLVEPVPYVLGVKGLTFDRLRSNFSQAEVDGLLTEDDKTLHSIAAQIIKFCGDKKFLVFMPTKDSARRLCVILNNHADNPHKCMEIDSDCHEEERQAFFEATKEGGPIRQLVGCDMLTEGYDCPDLEVVILCTKVGKGGQSVLIQRVGRVTRPLTETAKLLTSEMGPTARKLLLARSKKPIGIVVDMCGFSAKHNFVMPASLNGKELTEEVKREIGRIASEGTESPVRLDEIARQAEENLERKRREQAEEERRRKELDDLIYARADIEATRKNGLSEPGGEVGSISYKPEKVPASPDQVKFLKWKKLYVEGMTQKEAQALIKAIKADKASEWQMAVIRGYEGYDGETLDYYKADCIIKLMRARGNKGPMPIINRWNVSIRQNKADLKFRVYVTDSVTRKEHQYGEAYILSNIAQHIARRLCRD